MVVITDISYTASLDQDQDHDQKDIAPFIVDPNLLRNIKTLNNVKRFSENLKLSHKKLEEEIANILSSICLEIDRNVETERSEKENSSDSLSGHILPTKNGRNVQVSSSIVTEFVQDLLEELLSSDDPLQTIKYRYDPVTLKKIKGIPGYMVQRVTCSADKISRLTNPQIDYIIEQVNSKMIASHVNEISLTVAITSAHDSNSDDFNTNESDSDANKSDSDVYFKSDDSDANKSDSDIYFKSDDSDSDNEYDPKLYERLTREKMARLAKLEDKIPTKSAYEEDDFNKMLSEVIEKGLAYFDDFAPQSVMVTV
ncbi:hypothetical protein C1645_733357 [Glomus cerebriforme]|uniref:Uncharacterized protein n=1 Tax=Glomus cerebriforme TaxID=658196 RepID=A0A397TDN2_9GLOM|nr:hypothetical protein C1645_733357 [Glomus cerebriforme]